MRTLTTAGFMIASMLFVVASCVDGDDQFDAAPLVDGDHQGPGTLDPLKAPPASRECPFGCVGGTNNTPFHGAFDASNLSETANAEVWSPDGTTKLRLKLGGSSFRGTYSGSWSNTQSVTAIEVNDAGQLLINTGSGFGSPVLNGQMTALSIEAWINGSWQSSFQYLYIVGEQSVTANSRTVYKYSVNSSLNAGQNYWAGLGSPVCYEHVEDMDTSVVFLPNVHLELDGEDGDRPYLVSKNSADFTMACSELAIGKGRSKLGMLPNTSGGTNTNYGVSGYNSIIMMYMAWFNGETHTTHGTAITPKDFNHGSSPWFGGSVSEDVSESNYQCGPGGGIEVWCWDGGTVLESIYNANGATCDRTGYTQDPFPSASCGYTWANGAHRSGTLPAGWNSQSECSSSPSSGVGAYINYSFLEAYCGFPEG